LRLIWGEWSSRVTGSLSAILILLGFGISIAGIVGAKVPHDSIIQLSTWILAAVCGGQAAYAAWARERTARETAERAISDLKTRGISTVGVTHYDFDSWLHVAEMEVKNDSGEELGNCLASVTEIYRGTVKELIRDLPLALQTSLNRRRGDGGGPFNLRPGQTKKLPVCGARNDDTMLRIFVENEIGFREARGCSFTIHINVYGARNPATAKLLVVLNEKGEMEASLSS